MNREDVKAFTNDQLIKSTELVVRQEREIVDCLIWHLQEIQNRKLYIQMGFPDLYKCLIKHFKYSETTAYCRISALKMIEEIPAAADSLKSGEINITNLNLTRSFINKLEKKNGEKISVEEKTQYIEAIKNKTETEVKQFLATVDPVAELPHDRVQYLNDGHIQLHVTLAKKLLEKIEHLKSLISHENINPSYNEIFTLALDAAIEKVEKKKGLHVRETKKARPPRSAKWRKQSEPSENIRNPKECKPSETLEADETADTTKASESFQANGGCRASKDQQACETGQGAQKSRIPDNHRNSEGQNPSVPENLTQSFAGRRTRYIPRDVRRFVLKRAQHQCEFVHADGTRCSSKFQTQFDHIHAFSKGGTADIENIQLLCRVHNNYKGVRPRVL